MKLLTYSHNGKEALGVLQAGGQTLVALETLGLHFADMTDLICRMDETTEAILRRAEKDQCVPHLGLCDVELLSPIVRPRQDILCLGLNYVEHAEESARYAKRDFSRESQDPPVYFSKRANKILGTGADIPSHSDVVSRLDYEVELAVILKKDAYQVKAEEAADYVFGYAVFNDVSARDIQHQHKQWYRGKSLDGFAVMGPWIVTADELGCPPELEIQSIINGELRQNSNTSLQIFNIGYVLEELTAAMTLQAGTIIATGTPAGVGMGFTPPKFLSVGDTVECRIEGIGSIVNRIG